MNQRLQIRTSILTLLLASGLTILFSSQLSATSAIVFRRPDWLFFASDSKVSSAGHNSESLKNQCKIYGFRSTYFAMSGFPNDLNTKYDAESIVRISFSSTDKTFAEHVAAAQAELHSALAGELRWMKAHIPDAFSDLTKPSKPILSVALAQFENGHPLLAFFEFQYDRESDSLSLDPILGCLKSCEYPGEIFYMGAHTAIDRLRNSDPMKFDSSVMTTTDPSTTLSHLIELEIHEDSDHVGPPINVLGVSKDGPIWLAGGEGCNLK